MIRGLAVSNIAWKPHQDDAVADVLCREGVGGVELAPTLWRQRPFDASAADVAVLRRQWKERELEIVSLQSLLFGRPELQLFASVESRTALLEYLVKAIEFASRLEAGAVVFGSPGNRVRGDLPIAAADDIACDFFRALAARTTASGVTVCIEANPAAYGCDWITTTAESVALCRRIAHPAVRINADLGGMTMLGDDPRAAITAAVGLVGHFHASEPNLAALGTASDHARAAAALVSIEYDAWISIEMRAAPSDAKGEDGEVRAVERAVRLAKRAYAAGL